MIDQMMQRLQMAHGQIKSNYGKIKDMSVLLGHIRTEMDNLAQMGDAVSVDDVVKSAGRLVAHGVTPMGMATILAEMPPGGEALRQWIAEKDLMIGQREQEAKLALGGLRHELGTTSLRLLAGHAVKDGMEAPGPLAPNQPGQAPAPAPNPLAPQEGTANAG